MSGMWSLKRDKEARPRVGPMYAPSATAKVEIKYSKLTKAARSRRKRGRDGQDSLFGRRSAISFPIKIIFGVMAVISLVVFVRQPPRPPAEAGTAEATPTRSEQGAHKWEYLTPSNTKEGTQQPMGEKTAEQAELELRLEIARLEEQLRQKKALLELDVDTPLFRAPDGSGEGDVKMNHRRSDVKGGSSTNSMIEGGAPEHAQDLSNRKPRTNTPSIDLQPEGHTTVASPPIALSPFSPKHEDWHQRQRLPEPTGLFGEPVYGNNPVRKSLIDDENLIQTPVPLIVGGTDGSGTRGVVDLLQRLKVPMVVEDEGTKDVHGSPYMDKGGWPVVVRPVVQWAGGAGYDSYAAPVELRESTIGALGRLRKQMEKSAEKLQSKAPANQPTASYVSWGFKAPVAMLLVPFFQEAWGQVKFLHVVRDGRDIAFSGNQSPVKKFFDDTFPVSSRERGLGSEALMAVRLWSVWNSGLYMWAAAKRKGARASGPERQPDYLLLHVEDLIDPGAKFAAIKDVAEFVGSPLSDKELCCIATEPSRDMGSHTKAKSERGAVTSRFGKWKGKVKGNDKLAASLHEEGASGLRLLGYEPERVPRASSGFQCGPERQADCSGYSRQSKGSVPISRQPRQRENSRVPDTLADTDTCFGLVAHTDFKGLDLSVGNTADHLGCCAECRELERCTHFTFDYSSGNCYLKTGAGRKAAEKGLVSGFVAAVAS